MSMGDTPKKSGDGMFEQFPKTRPPLPKKFQDIYEVHYITNREGQTSASSMTKKIESWMHKKVANDLADRSEKSTLEIGAGTLNQLEYEPEVGPYDIIEPFKKLYEGSPLLRRVRNVYSDIREVPSQYRYDRITSVAAFEHILNLPEVAARAGLLLAANGVLRVAIPSEGTLLWALGYNLTTGLEFRIRYRLDYEMMMKHEHVNSAKEVEEVLEFFFGEVECSVLGISKSISFLQFYASRKPQLEKCHEYAGVPIT